jgi:hypothetical protein
VTIAARVEMLTKGYRLVILTFKLSMTDIDSKSIAFEANYCSTCYALSSSKNEKLLKSRRMHHRGHRVKEEKHKACNNQLSKYAAVFSSCSASVFSAVMLSASCRNYQSHLHRHDKHVVQFVSDFMQRYRSN